MVQSTIGIHKEGFMQSNHFFSHEKNIEDLIKKLNSRFSNDKSKLIIFFASSCYDFKKLSKEIQKAFIDSKIIGCTTTGELSSQGGFSDNSFVAVSLSGDIEVKTTFIDKITTVPILFRKNLIKDSQDLGINPNNKKSMENILAITLIDGLRMAEERVLSVINSIFHGELNLIGGSAGDDLAFKQTYICVNGESYTDAAVVAFIKTNKKVKIYKENIFSSQGKKMVITKVDERTRTIKEIDGRPAVTRYAEILGVNKNDLQNHILSNPIGRVIGDQTYITSIANLDGENINCYAQVFENVYVEVLKANDPLEVQKVSIDKIKNEYSSIDMLLCINCILRKLQFKNDGILDDVSNGLKRISEYTGFVSYGEQMGKIHMNQTLTMAVVGR